MTQCMLWSCSCTTIYSVHAHTSTGVGRIIAEAKSAPTVIPFWHVGKFCLRRVLCITFMI